MLDLKEVFDEDTAIVLDLEDGSESATNVFMDIGDGTILGKAIKDLENKGKSCVLVCLEDTRQPSLNGVSETSNHVFWILLEIGTVVANLFDGARDEGLENVGLVCPKGLVVERSDAKLKDVWNGHAIKHLERSLDIILELVVIRWPFVRVDESKELRHKDVVGVIVEETVCVEE